MCFALGILTAHLLNLNWKIYLSFCLFFAVISAILIPRQSGLIFLLLAFLSAGGLFYQIENRDLPASRLKKIYDEKLIQSGEPVEVEGIISGSLEEAMSGFFLKLEAERLTYKSAPMEVSGRILFFVPVADEQIAREYEQLNLVHGARILVACRLLREDKFRNPGVVSRKEVLDRLYIDATAIIKSPFLIEKISEPRTSSPLAWIFQIRNSLIKDFREKFSLSTAGILTASLLGNHHFLDKTTADLFREGGTFHVLVISGLHITFIGGLILLLLRFFIKNKRLWQFVIAVLFLWTYTIAVGAEIPVVRATIMFTVLLFSQVIYRTGNLLNALGFCGLILLVWRPNDLFSPSFQLTFVSVLAIIAAAFPIIEKLRETGQWRLSAETPFPPNVPTWLKRFCETFYWSEKRWTYEAKQHIWTARLFKSPYLKWLDAKGGQNIARYLFEGVLVSLIVQIWLLPLTAYYFHRVSIASVLLNLWVGFFIALESFAAIFAVLAGKLSEAMALPLVWLTEFFNLALLLIPKIFVENSWASFRVPVYSGNLKIIYLVYFAPILWLTVRLNNWNPFALVSGFKPPIHRFVSFGLLLLFSSLIVFHPFSAPSADGKLKVDFLDVGQGDAALVTFPNGETMLVDGGGKPNFSKEYIEREDGETELFEPDTATIGEAVVSQFLWEKGYSKIDYILASHAHADHFQGLIDVAKNFQIKAAFFGKLIFEDKEFAELLQVLQKRKVEIITLSRGDVLQIGETKAEVLFPAEEFLSANFTENNQSLVLRLVFGEKKILLTGDIEREAEEFLLQKPDFLQANVIKAAHHGSQTSSGAEFIEASQPQLVIISVGKNSPFGHPHREVVERWSSAGAKILTTGENGTITVSTDGKNLWLETFSSP